MKSINTIDEEIRALQHSVSEEEWDALRDEEQDELNRQARALSNEREILKKTRADVQDVQDSLKDISEAIPDVDLSKAVIISQILFDNNISKWELHVATAEILRSRHMFTTASEYFHAITRIKIKMQGSNSNIFDDKSLDF